MLSKYEKRRYNTGEHVWVGRYQNLHNISHWHLEHELIVCQSGRSRVIVNDQLFELNKGQCIFCPSGSTHYINADTDCILLVCLFEAGLTKNITANRGLKSPIYTDRYNTITVLSKIHSELCLKQPFYEAKTCAMTIDLMINVFRKEPLQSSDMENNPSLDNYKQLLNWIDKDFVNISFSSAAKFMNYSEPYFSKYFKKMSGMTFSQFLNTVRIEKAIDILETENAINMTDLMSRCGLNTIRNFNRIFKEITGYSPRHLPSGFSLSVSLGQTAQDAFDPTLNTSILL